MIIIQKKKEKKMEYNLFSFFFLITFLKNNFRYLNETEGEAILRDFIKQQRKKTK